jgi:trimethylamine--corrinoid protein Co-methyltransferase
MEHGAVPIGVQDDSSRAVGKLGFSGDMIDKALSQAPRSISLFDIPGENQFDIGGDNVHFDPGSAALYIHDPEEQRIRKPVTRDLQRFIRLVDKLPNYHLQSTALVSSDVPEACGDSYRLYLALKLGAKPVVTGTFEKESFAVMKEMLLLVRGGGVELKNRPLTIFDACPSPPLMWSDLTAHSVIEAARAGIPSEFVSMPLTGSTAPITLSGAAVQHAAETLAGVVLAQCAQAGAPVIWGGSPSAMDLRFGTTPMGAIETMMIDVVDVSVGKALGLPTHAYMGLSDAKRVDYQAGQESGLGLLLAALAGVNVVSGPGMMDFESCQSLEKLVLDHEVCGMAYRMLDGVAQRDEIMALNLLQSLPEGGHLLTDPHTLKWFREEIYSPGKAIDRRARGAEVFDDLETAEDRARHEVERLVSEGTEPSISEDISRELDRLMEGELKRSGAEELPR